MQNPIFPSLDVDTVEEAMAIARQIKPYVGGLKVGLQFFNRTGPDGVRAMAELGLPVFLDLKLHDIPNTVEKAAWAAAALGVQFLTIHCAGGAAMMRAALVGAAEGATEAGFKPPMILGVTVLTSLEDKDLTAMGWQSSPQEKVMKLARVAQKAGIKGLVASPQELTALHDEFGAQFSYMIPGIRPAGSDANDQKRVMTPVDALHAGATYLVIGRPITAAPDPGRAAADIWEDIQKNMGHSEGRWSKSA